MAQIFTVTVASYKHLDIKEFDSCDEAKLYFINEQFNNSKWHTIQLLKRDENSFINTTILEVTSARPTVEQLEDKIAACERSIKEHQNRISKERQDIKWYKEQIAQIMAN